MSCLNLLKIARVASHLKGQWTVQFLNNAFWAITVCSTTINNNFTKESYPVWVDVLVLCVLKDIFHSQKGKKCVQKDIFCSHKEIIWVPKDSIHHMALMKLLVFLSCCTDHLTIKCGNNPFGSAENLCKARVKPKTALGKNTWNVNWEPYLAAGAK